VTDQLERYLREEFAADALRAPIAGDLAGVAKRRAERERRRRAFVAVAALVSVVLAAGLVANARSDRRSTLPAVDRGGHRDGKATDRDLGPLAVLSLHGVQMRVPARMLGTPCTLDRDVAYVVKGGGPHPSCVPSSRAVDEHRTTVVMAALAGPITGHVPEGPTVLADGNTWQVVLRTDRDVRIDITSPDPALVARLAATVRMEVPPLLRPTNRNEAVRGWLENPDVLKEWTAGLTYPPGGRLYCAVTIVGQRPTGHSDLNGSLARPAATFDLYVWALCERLYVDDTGSQEKVGQGAGSSAPLLLHVIGSGAATMVRDAEFPSEQSPQKDLDRLFPADVADQMRSGTVVPRQADLLTRARADLEVQKLPYRH
jgi:hypothetical protein